jgi:hypothetical protein
MKLLLRITLKTDLFDEVFIDRAQAWLTTLEGSRRRGNRYNLFFVVALPLNDIFIFYIGKTCTLKLKWII